MEMNMFGDLVSIKTRWYEMVVFIRVAHVIIAKLQEFVYLVFLFLYLELQRASEHARMYHGFIPTTKENLTSEHLFDASSQLEDIPASLDWRERGYVTEVKTQVRLTLAS